MDNHDWTVSQPQDPDEEGYRQQAKLRAYLMSEQHPLGQKLQELRAQKKSLSRQPLSAESVSLAMQTTCPATLKQMTREAETAGFRLEQLNRKAKAIHSEIDEAVDQVLLQRDALLEGPAVIQHVSHLQRERAMLQDEKDKIMAALHAASAADGPAAQLRCLQVPCSRDLQGMNKCMYGHVSSTTVKMVTEGRRECADKLGVQICKLDRRIAALRCKLLQDVPPSLDRLSLHHHPSLAGIVVQ